MRSNTILYDEHTHMILISTTMISII